MKNTILFVFCFNFLSLVSCQNSTEIISEEMEPENKEEAVVREVTVSGSENAYQFSVTIESPDTGCEQYADWWEVFSESGDLIYRRILGHSHVDEQPFTRSGSPVNIESQQIVYIRAHMNPLGYGTKLFHGNVKDGFVPMEVTTDLAADLETKQPLPTNCAF